MNRIRPFIVMLPMLLAACQSTGDRDTIARLRDQQIEIREEKIEGGLDKAMQGYQHFLEEAPDSALAPEAIRRLADLKIEKEYGTLTVAGGGTAADADGAAGGADDLERARAREAIALYTKLLSDYPHYEHNDQVLYQMSRACEELGQVEEAMQVMDRMVREYPRSRYMDEVQFRRAEYFFTRRSYRDAEDAYASIVKSGAGSSFYELALYKLGWTFYKQEFYEEALDRFMALLDHKVSRGYDFAQTADEQEQKRTEDTFRVISLGFSNLGGADSVVNYFARSGKRTYEDSVYRNLGEFYFDKRRYADAGTVYNAFVIHNPFHKAAPNFHMRVIEIHAAGGFPSLVLEAKKQFVGNYGLQAGYWKHFDPGARPEVLAWLKANLTDLAKYYHALYQSPQQIKDKKTNFKEALHWYREFLASFPMDPESPSVNYLLADLFLEDHSFDLAAREYEKTAYEYPRHEKSPQAGYAAIYAYRQQLAGVAVAAQEQVKREVIRSSLKFTDSYPEHEKAAIVLGAAADDLYDMREYEPAAAAARKLIEAFPGAEVEVVRTAWLVVGHSTYELLRYGEAETAYLKVLALLAEGDKTREALIDNLAAAIYKQGEQANVAQEYRVAADHFLRVGRMAPTSKIRPNAEYDAAAALIRLKDWATAAEVLVGFRNTFTGNALQPEVTKKIAYVYKEDNKLSRAADEYERIETESPEDEVRREALLTAADLHEQAGNSNRALEVYRRYVGYFPHPVEPNLETRTKIAEALKKNNDHENYLEELRQIVAADAYAGGERTPRTRYLAGKAALVLAEQTFGRFADVRLVKPFEANLHKKKELMQTATREFDKLLDYEVGEVTAAATFYLAEIYARFSKDLTTSERPEGLNPMEREQYELGIEEQAYPFEEKAIRVHESNLKLISRGVYNVWVEKSIQKLAEFVPARYDKPEESSGIVSSLETFIFEIHRPAPPATPESGPTDPVRVEKPGAVTAPESADPAPTENPEAVREPEIAGPFQDDHTNLPLIRTDEARRR